MVGCPVCGFADVRSGPGAPHVQLFDCPICGQFGLSGLWVRAFGLTTKPGTLQAAVLSHAIRKMQREKMDEPDQWPILELDEIERITKDVRLPSPAEQADNLLTWLGDNAESSGEWLTITYERLRAIVGAKTGEGVAFVARELLDKGLIDCQGQSSHQLRHLPACTATLSLEGWQRYEALKRGATDSRKAFMAMKYGDATLDEVFRECFKPAVATAGFDLVRLDEKPRAGLIDDRLRVEIRSSRFVVADLTHSNLGAYWEAGYAEDLGKPVIYTCEKSVFDKQKTHFDTNHHLTVPWEATNLEDAAQRLKDTIRATLPAESKLTD